jgi:hypothetical protein
VSIILLKFSNFLINYMNHHIPNSLLNGVFFFYYGFFYSLAIGGLGLTTGLLFKEF